MGKLATDHKSAAGDLADSPPSRLLHPKLQVVSTTLRLFDDDVVDISSKGTISRLLDKRVSYTPTLYQMVISLKSKGKIEWIQGIKSSPIRLELYTKRV